MVLVTEKQISNSVQLVSTILHFQDSFMKVCWFTWVPNMVWKQDSDPWPLWYLLNKHHLTGQNQEKVFNLTSLPTLSYSEICSNSLLHTFKVDVTTLGTRLSESLRQPQSYILFIGNTEGDVFLHILSQQIFKCRDLHLSRYISMHSR